MELTAERKCPECGSRNVGEGVIDGYANIRPKGKPFTSSRLFALVCGDCGVVFNLRVEKPQKFSRREE